MVTLDVARHGSVVSLHRHRLRVTRPELPDAFAVIEELDLVVVEVPAVTLTGGAMDTLCA